jgi:hypothetical protein
MTHTLPPNNLDLQKALHAERHKLKRVEVPIVTVSATYRKELIRFYKASSPLTSEAIFSRAHYSMAEAVRQQARDLRLTTHLVDPTNFVSVKDWSKIEFTETVGRQMARHKLLKIIKDKIDTIARSKLPITEAITSPLLYLTTKVSHPIISMHYEAGNIIASCAHKTVQVITDPHVRPQYLDPLPQINQLTNEPTSQIRFAVFDETTKLSFISMAQELGKEIDPNHIIVTGPPIDPRINKLKSKPKHLPNHQPINIGITTGGLGTNLSEIKQVLTSFIPFLNPPEKVRLFLFAGAHRDFRDFFEAFAHNHNLKIGNLDDESAVIRILYEDSIIDANDNLIRYMFPWAHVIITKPSGDMAYDAAAAGCALLFLQPWGIWEENIQHVFLKNGVGFDLNTDSAHNHLARLVSTGNLHKAIINAQNLPPLFHLGAKKIIEIQRNFK